MKKNRWPAQILKSQNSMETNFEKLKRILERSLLPDADRLVFMESCTGVVDGNLELMVDLFSTHPEWIRKVIENFKEKRNAAADRDMQAWRNIIAKEAGELDDMEKLEEIRGKIE
jgi:hypothetical protein